MTVVPLMVYVIAAILVVIAPTLMTGFPAIIDMIGYSDHDRTNVDDSCSNDDYSNGGYFD